MAAKTLARRWPVGLLVPVVVAALLLALVAVAHFTGVLAPFYHWVGWHEMAGHDQHAGHAGSETHAGHDVVSTSRAKAEPSKVPGYSIVAVSPARQQLIGVRTGTVERGRLVMHIRTVGIVEPDQTRLRRLHPRISGWVTKVYVNFIGQKVKKDDPLLEIYSPELLATQEEYLIALAGLETADTPDQRRLVESSRKRLELWGVPKDEIERLRTTRKAKETLTLRAPIEGEVLARNVLEGSYVDPSAELYRLADLSVVWVQAKIYEHELPHIELKQRAEVTLPSRPGKVFEGTVSFVEPILQEQTRTVKVRVALPNADGVFKPGMFADLKFEHDMGEGLLVPESAVLRTGERAIAFRVLERGRFEPVEVKLGARFGDRFEVLDGLSEGDEVVTSGNFLIDSESRLKAAVGMMGHQH